ncbi:MAG: Tad domain-containing protein [Kiritimatiellia bacterium]
MSGSGISFRIRRRSGQTVIFLIMVVAILAFVVLWNFDLHKILFVKSRSQNAGDSAALAASRWQGITLNLIGDLNIMQALALSSGNAGTVESISNIQARLCYTGPMIAMQACQQAAKNNHIYVNDGFTERLMEHAEAVRNEYTQITPSGEMLFPEPYPGCWLEYSAMLEVIARDGVAAGPDNARLYTDWAMGSHILLNPAFYDAIAGKSWCWFYHNAYELLRDYDDYSYWEHFPLPELPHRQYINSEIFGLGLSKHYTTLSFLGVSTSLLTSVAGERRLGEGIDTNGMSGTAAWYCYDNGRWSAWDAMAVSGPDAAPLTGPVKPQYDYAGADSAVRVNAEAARLTPAPGGGEVTNTITWTAAAKVFGYLNDDDRPNAYDIVLPAFHNVRLIPVDASSAPAAGAYDLEWRDHVEEHLEEYLVNGPRERSCRYCRQLVVWESDPFRQEGIDWLRQYSHLCTVPPPGGGGHRGGGRRRAH